MTDPATPGTPSPRAQGLATWVRVLMVIVGIVLLLPGLCAILVGGGLIIKNPANALSEGGLVVLWIICLAISAVGILLIRKAR